MRSLDRRVTAKTLDKFTWGKGRKRRSSPCRRVSRPDKEDELVNRTQVSLMTCPKRSTRRGYNIAGRLEKAPVRHFRKDGTFKFQREKKKKKKNKKINALPHPLELRDALDTPGGLTGHHVTRNGQKKASASPNAEKKLLRAGGSQGSCPLDKSSATALERRGREGLNLFC